MCRPPGGDDESQPLHFEVIANTWDCCDEPTDGSGWLDKRAKEIELLANSENLAAISKEDDRKLPRALALATSEARKWCKREEDHAALRRIFFEKFSRGNADALRAREQDADWKIVFGDEVVNTNASDRDDGEGALKFGTENRRELDGKAYRYLRDAWDNPGVNKSVERLLGRTQRKAKS